jgi:hypothetical protein
MKKHYYVFPGSFKPPHYGHYTIVLRLCQQFERNREMEKSEIHIFISRKERVLPISQIPIDMKVSYEVWSLWKQCLPIEYQSMVHIHQGYFPSPILDAVSFGKKKIERGGEIYMVKSKKDLGNDRFKDIVKKMDGFHEIELEVVEDIHSSDIRQKMDEMSLFQWRVFSKVFKKEYPLQTKLFYNIFYHYYQPFFKKGKTSFKKM